MGLRRRDRGHHSYADYLRSREDVRYELIDAIAGDRESPGAAPAAAAGAGSLSTRRT